MLFGISPECCSASPRNAVRLAPEYATEGLTGPVNIGNPNEFTIRELADMVISLTGSRSEIVHRPLPQDDPVQRQPDISLATEKLGWQPIVPLKEGLVPTIEYFENILSEDRRDESRQE